MNRYIPAELKRLVAERALFRCEYCLLPQAFGVVKFHFDHILPMKHTGQTISENLALACPNCNEHKGSDIGSYDFESDEKFAPFFNPRTQIWTEHFQFSGVSIMPLTAEARVTERIFRLNDAERIEEREILIEAGIYE